MKGDRMAHDPELRAGLASRLADHGRAAQEGDEMGGFAGELVEFAVMPIEMARVMIDMATEMADVCLAAIEELGYVVVKGTTPL